MQFSEIIPFSIGILFLFMINSTWARFFGGTESINILFGFMATIIVSLFTIFDLLSKNIEYLKTFIKSSFLISTLVTWIFLIPILEDSRREVLFGITSLGNNDLPLYAQLSMHNLNYGFRGEGQISPISGTIEAGEYLSNYTYIGTIAVIDFLSAFFSFNVIQATSLTLMISVGFLFMSLRHLGNILNLNSTLSNLLASIGILLPVSLYSISMGFIGALFGIASFAVMISGSLSFAKKQISEQEFILIMTLGLSIGIYTYAQISIPILVALSFIHKINNILEEKKGRKYQLVKCYGMAGFLGTLLSFSAIPNLITLTKVLSGEGFGWKLQFFDPIDVFFVDSKYFKSK